MTRRAEKKWASEAEMLQDFMEHRRAEGWSCYPESCGHDLILVCPPRTGLREGEGPRAGDTVAIEGKLRGTMGLLRQAIPPWRRGFGDRKKPVADWYCVVVGQRVSRDFRELANVLGVMLHTHPPRDDWGGHQRPRWPWWPKWEDRDRAPTIRLRLEPILAVEMRPGLPAPRRVTDWKIRAVTACLALRSGPPQTSAEIGPALARSLRTRGWIEPVGKKGRGNLWGISDAPDTPDLKYPEIAAALAGRVEPTE